MIKIFYSFVLLLLSMQFWMCRPAHSTLVVHKLANYNPSVSDHILFLNFRVSKLNNTSSEKVELVNSISGTGKMKNLSTRVSNPNHIRMIQHFTDGRNVAETSYEHPLFASVEASDPNAKMTRSTLSVKEAVLSVRIQEDKAMDKIELYSITPEKGSVKIYSIRLKQ